MSSSDEDPVTANMVVQVVQYDPRLASISFWDEGTVLRAEVLDSPERTVVFSGNKAGLISLARHLLTLAQETVPAGSHMDFDSYCGWLADGSAAIRIEVER
jgi:hypothetical protein